MHVDGVVQQVWKLDWEYGCAEVQALGGMLGPLEFRLPDGRRLQAMHVAPWANEAKCGTLPGILQRLRGEWPCVPFGRVDPQTCLPSGWQTFPASDPWAHGYASHHAWHCIDASPASLHLAIDYPADSVVSRLERRIRVDPDSARLDVSLTISVRQRISLPIAFHPTFRVPAEPGRLLILPGNYESVVSYPVAAEAGISRLLADTVSNDLAALPDIEAGSDPLDLTHLPLPFKTEELLQIKNLRQADGRAPIVLHYLDEDVQLGLIWDTVLLPDAMLWFSNGGRSEAPWSGRHFALGVEPLNGVFDLGRVASPPSGHPLAERHGVALTPEFPLTIHYSLAAW